jgi:dTDP-4-amino-4,6-dideoxygalactose transaminase
VLRVKLHHLDRWNSLRRAVAHEYVQGFASSANVVAPVERSVCRHVYHQFTIRATDRDALMQRLAAEEIGAVVYYPRALHLQQVYAHLGHKLGDFPETERAQDQVVSLPMYPELTSAQVYRVIESVMRFYQPAAKAI